MEPSEACRRTTGSGASSSSSSDERNDEDDDGTTLTSFTIGIITDHTSNTHKRDEDHYENVKNDEICTLEYCSSYDAHQRFAAVSSCDRYPRLECVETALINERRPHANSEIPVAATVPTLSTIFVGIVSLLAPSTTTKTTSTVGSLSTKRLGKTREIITWYLREIRKFNERILSLFNPQFLPNFNDMITYVAAPISSPPPPRSHSTVR